MPNMGRNPQSSSITSITASSVLHTSSNICSSHVISSMTSVSKQYLSELEVLVDSSPTICHDPEDELDDDDYNYDDDGIGIAVDHNLPKLDLDDCYNDYDISEFEQWLAGIKHNLLRHAHRVIRLLRSLDKCREGFHEFINAGNKQGWFIAKKPGGKRKLVKVPELQPLRDVKMRWDSVFMMLEHLRQLRLVSSSQALSQCLINYLMQAVNMYLDTKLSEFAHWKLSDYDWYVLKGLETVLNLSHLINSWTSTHITTDSS